MPQTVSHRGRLPACRLDRSLFRELMALLADAGPLEWQAEVGTAGDLLGEKKDRPKELIRGQDELFARLDELSRIDSLQFTAEVQGKGALSFTFSNHGRPAGALAVEGEDAAWADSLYDTVIVLFDRRSEPATERLYSKAGFLVIHSGIPLIAASVVVVAISVILIPAEIRQSEWLMWISVGTVIATMRLAYTFSNKLIAYVLARYPYIRWLKG